MSYPLGMMNDGLRLGRIGGIEINLAASFLPLLVLLVLSLSALAGGLAGALLLAALLAASVVAHELGHALTARAFGIRTRAITLHLLGGVAKIEGEPRRPAHEILVAAAGPAVSLGLAALFLALSAVVGLLALPGGTPLLYLAVANFALAVFNLLPGLPLDGGRILRGILWARRRDRRSATIAAARAGEWVAYLVFVLAFLRLVDPAGGLFAALFPAIMGWFLLSAARAERTRALLEGRGAAAFVRLQDLLRGLGSPEFRPFGMRPGPAARAEADEEVIRFPDGRELYTRRRPRSDRAHE